LVVTSVLVESTTGACAVTVMVSDCALTFSWMSSTAVPPSDTVTPVWELVEKPESSAVTSYVPGGGSGSGRRPIRCSPSWERPERGPRSVTVTPGRIAPDSS